MKILVAAAWEPELERFRTRIAGAAHVTARIEVAAIGVGLVEGAIGTARAIERHAPDAALLLGTAGAFVAEVTDRGPGSAVTGTEVVVASSVRLVDGAAACGDAAVPAPMPVDVDADARVVAPFETHGARRVQIANTVGITTTDAYAAQLASASGADVEHLEAFAFARACASASPPVPFAIVLGITNVVGATGRAEWLANHVAASARAADVAFDAFTDFVRAVERARGASS